MTSRANAEFAAAPSLATFFKGVHPAEAADVSALKHETICNGRPLIPYLSQQTKVD